MSDRNQAKRQTETGIIISLNNFFLFQNYLTF